MSSAVLPDTLDGSVLASGGEGRLNLWGCSDAEIALGLKSGHGGPTSAERQVEPGARPAPQARVKARVLAGASWSTPLVYRPRVSPGVTDWLAHGRGVL